MKVGIVLPQGVDLTRTDQLIRHLEECGIVPTVVVEAGSPLAPPESLHLKGVRRSFSPSNYGVGYFLNNAAIGVRNLDSEVDVILVVDDQFVPTSAWCATLPELFEREPAARVLLCIPGESGLPSPADVLTLLRIARMRCRPGSCASCGGSSVAFNIAAWEVSGGFDEALVDGSEDLIMAANVIESGGIVWTLPQGQLCRCSKPHARHFRSTYYMHLRWSSIWAQVAVIARAVIEALGRPHGRIRQLGSVIGGIRIARVVRKSEAFLAFEAQCVAGHSRGEEVEMA